MRLLIYKIAPPAYSGNNRMGVHIQYQLRYARYVL